MVGVGLYYEKVFSRSYSSFFQKYARPMSHDYARARSWNVGRRTRAALR